MEIRDPVHGSIPIRSEEEPILEHAFFQRLRNIKQLGLSEYAFPGATHTRYLHSIGVFHLTTQLFDKLFANACIEKKDYERLKETVRLAALLHDIGHAPLSHSTELVMPLKKDLAMPNAFLEDGLAQASHEDYTIKAIVDSSFTESFKKIKNKYGIEVNEIAGLIRGRPVDSNYFIINNKNYFPVLSQMISSEIDCDRMDYLLRDSYFCGVSYGKFDVDWIFDNLQFVSTSDGEHLGLTERAIATFDDFLLSRFHMFLMVYFHYRAVCLEQMLYQYFSSKDNEYFFPKNIEEYITHDDHYLMKLLRRSNNKWAKMVVANKIPLKVFEIFGSHNIKKFEEIKEYLESNSIEKIICESRGRLSKYYQASNKIAEKKTLPLYIIKQYADKNGPYLDLTKATDVFDKYSKAHEVKRIHALISENGPELNDINKIIAQ